MSEFASPKGDGAVPRRNVKSAIVMGWLVLLAAALWIAPPAGDDAYAHAVMAVEQATCWQHGVIWPRFHPDWNGGTGSFLPAVYSPLVLSADAALTLVTQEGTRSVALSLIAALAAGACFMAIGSGRKDLPWWLFAFAPYLLVNVFSRATVTETWALAAVAGVLVFVLPSGVSRPKDGLVALAGMMIAAGAQPVMLLIVGVPAAVTWALALTVRRGAGFGRQLGWGVAWMAGTAIFWMPPLLLIKNLDRAAVFSGHYGWQGHFVTNIHGNGQLGPVLLAIWLALGIIAIASGLVLRGRFDLRSGAMLTFVVMCLVLASPVSVVLWELPGMRLAQFPWRFLGPASIGAIYLFARLPRSWRFVLTAVFLVPLAFLPVEVDGGQPALRPDLPAGQLAKVCSIRYGIAPILPSTPGEYARGFQPLKSLAALHNQRGVKVITRSSSCTSRMYRVSVADAGPVLLPVQWWPTWDLRVDGKPARFTNRLGLVSVPLGTGSHAVSMHLVGSGARVSGGLMTAGGLLLAGFLWWFYGRRKGG